MPDNIRLYDIAVKVSPTQHMQYTDNIQENNENPDTQLLHKPSSIKVLHYTIYLSLFTIAEDIKDFDSKCHL